MASKRRIKRKACVGKRQFADQTAAVAAMMCLLSRGESGLSSYKCQFGGHWHIGHSTARNRRMAEMRQGQ